MHTHTHTRTQGVPRQDRKVSLVPITQNRRPNLPQSPKVPRKPIFPFKSGRASAEKWLRLLYKIEPKCVLVSGLREGSLGRGREESGVTCGFARTVGQGSSFLGTMGTRG